MTERINPLTLLRSLRDADKRAAGLRQSSVLALVVLVLRADGSGDSYPSHDCIGADMGCDPKTVRGAIAELTRAGLVQVTQGRQHQPNRYHVSRGVLTGLGRHQHGRTSRPEGGPRTGETPVLPNPGGEILPARGGNLSRQGGRNSRGSNPRSNPRSNPHSTAPAAPLALTGEPSPSEPKKSSSAEKTKGTRLASDWQPSPEVVRWAYEELDGTDALACVPEFRDFWVAVAGAKGVKLDWDATFRNRLRELHRRGQAPELVRPAPPPAIPADVVTGPDRAAKIARAQQSLKAIGNGGAT